MTAGWALEAVASVRVEPVPPADGRCVQCGKRRHPERAEKYGREEALRDPFCSRICCEDFHGVERRQLAGKEEMYA